MLEVMKNVLVLFVSRWNVRDMRVMKFASVKKPSRIVLVKCNKEIPAHKLIVNLAINKLEPVGKRQ